MITKDAFCLGNWVMTGLLFMLFDWLQQYTNQSHVMKINPIIICLLNQNAPNNEIYDTHSIIGN